MRAPHRRAERCVFNRPRRCGRVDVCLGTSEIARRPRTPEWLARSRPRRIEPSALAALPVKRLQVRFPIGRLRQSRGSACIRGSAPWSGSRRGRAETGSGPVRRQPRGTDARRCAADRVGAACRCRRDASAWLFTQIGRERWGGFSTTGWSRHRVPCRYANCVGSTGPLNPEEHAHAYGPLQSHSSCRAADSDLVSCLRC